MNGVRDSGTQGLRDSRHLHIYTSTDRQLLVSDDNMPARVLAVKRRELDEAAEAQ
jgi:hypothetical protein